MPEPITKSDYALEIFQGPVLAPIRVTGLGGAYIAQAEGVEGSAVNSAAPAVRDATSYRWTDFDLSLGASFLGGLAHTDFDNRGTTPSGQDSARVGDFVDLNFGGQLQLGYLGFGATGDLQQYSLSSRTSGIDGLTMQIGRWKALAGYGLFKGQLVVGTGLRVATMQITQNGGDNAGTLLTMTGAAPEAGALWMPYGYPWRVGATVRAAVSGTSSGSGRVTYEPGVARVGSVVLPSQVVMPWEAEIGFAYQLGPRPLNPTWLDPHAEEARVRERIEQDRAARERARIAELAALPPDRRATREAELVQREQALRELEDQRLSAEKQRLYYVRRARYDNWPREKILLLASVLVTGPSESAISLQGFLDQRRELVGRSSTLTPRLGIEGEPIQNRLLARIGTYVEPSRYEDGFPRQHFTFGGDVKLFPFDLWGLLGPTTWKLGLYVDLAPRYTNAGFGIGTWH